jgi:transposase
MEDILDLYALPYNPEIPLICMDEQPVQLLGDRYETIEMKPGRPGKEDFQYVRNGTCSIFMFTEPLGGWRHVNAKEHRTKLDWAAEIRELLEVHYPNVSKIRLVMDNLNTHVIGSLYEAFRPEDAHSLARRLEIHYTPKHGSWLNVAEIELSAMTKQCLNRRIPDIEKLNKEISAWEKSRNSDQKTVDWQFTTASARGKLKSLYPKI